MVKVEVGGAKVESGARGGRGCGGEGGDGRAEVELRSRDGFGEEVDELFYAVGRDVI